MIILLIFKCEKLETKFYYKMEYKDKNFCFYLFIYLFIYLLETNIIMLTHLFKICSRLSLSQSPRDSLKYIEVSVPQHIRFAEFRKNKSNNHISQISICNLTHEVRDILTILWKRNFHFEISGYSR